MGTKWGQESQSGNKRGTKWEQSGTKNPKVGTREEQNGDKWDQESQSGNKRGTKWEQSGAKNPEVGTREELHSRYKANFKECNHFPTLLLGTTKENTSYLPARTLAVTKELLFNAIRDRMQIR